MVHKHNFEHTASHFREKNGKISIIFDQNPKKLVENVLTWRRISDLATAKLSQSIQVST